MAGKGGGAVAGKGGAVAGKGGRWREKGGAVAVRELAKLS